MNGVEMECSNRVRPAMTETRTTPTAARTAVQRLVAETASSPSRPVSSATMGICPAATVVPPPVFRSDAVTGSSTTAGQNRATMATPVAVTVAVVPVRRKSRTSLPPLVGVAGQAMRGHASRFSLQMELKNLSRSRGGQYQRNYHSGLGTGSVAPLS